MTGFAETVFALSTAPGRAGIAVIRMSGPATQRAVTSLVGGLPEPRRAVLRSLRNANDGSILDRGLVIWFPGPRSFTGEDMAEFHVHGGLAVVSGVLDALAEITGLRPAGLGEFTRRAFENGKLDLSEAEAIADLIDAETQAQRTQALAQASGTLSAVYQNWRADLIQAMALIETGLDFSDEGGIPAESYALAVPAVDRLIGELRQALDNGRRGEIIREGIKVAITGAPNAGKSSLLNALAQREAAIVSAEPGTTRDIIDVRLDLAGYPFIFSDTAGLRDAAGEVEREGIRRALVRAEEADLVLYLQDITKPAQASSIEAYARKTIPVWTKADLSASSATLPEGLAISVLTGQGMSDLQAILVSSARDAYGLGEPALITRARHRQEIEAALSALLDFRDDPAKDAELLAQDLRFAANALGRLTGRVDVEDVLGQIFADFCIGK